MKYAAVNIQGNILTSEILEKIRTEDFRYQKPLDFGFEPTASLKDEISLAYSVATSHWKAFQHKREKLRDNETGTTDTRRAWMIPLLQLLGFDISVANAEIINGKSYAISHRATNLDGFPVHLVGINQFLDKRADSGGARLSPHALGQEYLNNHEHLYALVSNGKYLRLLRDATLLSRLSFVEFDLEQIMEENLYAEFALMFRLLHASRMPQKIEEGPDSKMEFYHVEALASGSRIRERLSMAVEVSIKDLANGLMKHPSNKQLRDAVKEDKIKAKDYYLYNLRTIYRILFLLVIEDRKLIYPEKVDEELARKQKIYYDFYSLQRLTNLAEKLVYVDPKKTDLWDSLLTIFSLFEYKEYGDKLGIAPLGSGIFHPDSLGKIRDQKLDNETLLKVLRCLVSFENENKQRVRVNYADLDVEEFGSVYEGLLEYEPKFEEQLGLPVFTFVEGDERSSSGSHYTPEELVKPLIDHSLQYQIEDKLKEDDPEKGLLSLTVCDVACGSGHILLSAARRIGFELAKERSGEDQPTPSLLRIAIRDVIKNCIYGVDLNPLAVELCKVALWLEAHEPGEPLNFLDHHIKCGNAIVGLAHFEELKNGIATEAFITLPGDDKDVAATFRKANTEQRKTKGQLSLHDLNKVETEVKDIQQEFTSFLKMPEHTPKQIEAKTKAYENLISGKKWFRVKELADLQVAQFFIPKTEEIREKLTTEAKYQNYLNSGAQIQDRGASMAMATEKRFFHWFLEFPEVFGSGGFDCILGNPPYLGGNKVSKRYGFRFSNYFHSTFLIDGSVDLIVYFLHRIFSNIKSEGALSLITVQSVREGVSRKQGLFKLLNNGLILNFSSSDVKWPGKANTLVNLITGFKKRNKKFKICNGKSAESINSYLVDDIRSLEPFKLSFNKNISFQGVALGGNGFLMPKEEGLKILNSNPEFQSVLKRFLIGDDINSDWQLEPSRMVIDFSNLTEKEAQEYPELYEKVKNLVYPERRNNKRLARRKYWYHFAEKATGLFKSIDKCKTYLVTGKTSKYLSFVQLQEKDLVLDQSLTVIAIDGLSFLPILQSDIHLHWARKYSTSQGGTPRYNPSDSFQNYPLPDISSSTLIQNLETVAEKYLDLRGEILSQTKLGLTKLYNQFHNSELIKNVNNLPDKDFIKLYGKETWSLFNHLEIKKQGSISFENAVMLILELREIHKEIDSLTLQLYGWNDLKLFHDFYEVDYLPESDRVRYSIHPDARKEILKRLLKLNHERFEEEAAQGLHKKKEVEAYFSQKAEEIPDGIAVNFSKKKSRRKKVTKKIAKSNTVQKELFTEETSKIMKEFGLHDGIYTIRDVATIINKSTDRVRRWFLNLAQINYEGLDDSSQKDIEQRRISFHGLIELVIIGELLDNNFKIRKIFKAREDLAARTGKTYPFATNDVHTLLNASGSDITWDFPDGNITLDGKGQFNIEIVREFFRDIEFDTSGIAQRIIPSKGLGKVEITPKRAGGKPSIISQQGVQVETIVRYYDGPESIDDIISDYGISEEDINAALAYQS